MSTWTLQLFQRGSSTAANVGCRMPRCHCNVTNFWAGLYSTSNLAPLTENSLGYCASISAMVSASISVNTRSSEERSWDSSATSTPNIASRETNHACGVTSAVSEAGTSGLKAQCSFQALIALVSCSPAPRNRDPERMRDANASLSKGPCSGRRSRPISWIMTERL